MSIAYLTAAKNNRLAVALLAGAVTPASGQSVDANSSFGTLAIGTSALSGATGLLALIILQKPSFSISGGVATLLGVPLSAVATGTGTAAKAELRDSGSNVIAGGMTVGTSATDVILNSTSISTGQTVTVTSGTITAT